MKAHDKELSLLVELSCQWAAHNPEHSLIWAELNKLRLKLQIMCGEPDAREIYDGATRLVMPLIKWSGREVLIDD